MKRYRNRWMSGLQPTNNSYLNQMIKSRLFQASPSLQARGALRGGGTCLFQLEYKLHLTNRDSGYEVMSK